MIQTSVHSSAAFYMNYTANHHVISFLLVHECHLRHPLSFPLALEQTENITWEPGKKWEIEAPDLSDRALALSGFPLSYEKFGVKTTLEIELVHRSDRMKICSQSLQWGCCSGFVDAKNWRRSLNEQFFYLTVNLNLNCDHFTVIDRNNITENVL